MIVRGAPAIGVAAAFGLAMAIDGGRAMTRQHCELASRCAAAVLAVTPHGRQSALGHRADAAVSRLSFWKAGRLGGESCASGS